MHRCTRTVLLNRRTYDEFGEFHGVQARCIPQDIDTALGVENLGTYPVPPGAGCYKTDCENGELHVTIGDARFRCPSGEYVDLPTGDAAGA